MSERETNFLGRYGRFVWGGAAALLLLAFVTSFVLSGSSVSGAELEAQKRAEGLASSVVEERLTPDLLTRDIDGTDYRDLTVHVQAGILSDDRFEVVRIWRLDAGLIYSTAQRDDVNGVAAADDRYIAQALRGQTVSVLSSDGTYHQGLKRPTEELFQTFIPIRLSGAAVDGVVQIDQRYGAIHNQAMRLWRPVQIVVLLLLIGVGVMLARTFRGGASYGEGGVERRQSPGRRLDDVSVRDAADRAEHAESRVHETEKRVSELEAQLARAPSTATATAAVEELELKLRASEAEREELAGTVKRLQSELVESQAAVTLARDGSAGTKAETKRINRLIADAESKAVAAERKAAAAEKKSQEAAKRASVSAERGLELEAQLREAQKLADDVQKLSGGGDQPVADAERRAADTETGAAEAGEGVRRKESGDRKIASELRQAEAERDQLDELERALTESKARAGTSERELALKNGPKGRADAPHPKRHAEPAPVPAYITAADDPEASGDVDDPFGVSSEAFATPTDRWSDSPAPAEEPVAEEPADVLSLRERLARAAAARRRLS